MPTAADVGAVAAIALTVTVLVQGAFHLTLDLRDFPGAASGTIVLAAARLRDLGASGLGPVDHLMAELAQLPAGDLVLALHLWTVLFVVAAAFGAGLGGLALGGRTAGVAAAVLTATFSQTAWLGWCISYDGLALGLSWLGVGLTLFGAARSRFGLLLIPVGLAMVGLGVLAKEVAHPALAWLAAVPVLAATAAPRLRALTGLAVAGMVGGAALALQRALIAVGPAPRLPASPRHTAASIDLAPADVIEGLSSLWTLLAHSDPTWMNILVPLAAVAALGALLPGRAWLARVTLGLAGVVALGVMASVITAEWLRIRYFGVPVLPVIVLAAAAVGALGDQLGRLHPVLKALPVLVAGGLLLHDSASMGQAWHATRASALELEEPDLPALPAWIWNVNDMRVRTHYSDTSLRGAIELRRLMRQQEGEGPVAVIAMRDGRHRHALAIAALDAGRHGELITGWMIQAFAFPSRTIRYEVGTEYAWLAPGDVLTLTDAELSLDEQVCLLQGVSWESEHTLALELLILEQMPRDRRVAA